MFKRDIIKDQIDQLGKVLSQLMAKLIGMSADGNVVSGINQSKKEFNEQLDINLDELISMEENNLSDYLGQRHFTGALMEQLSDYLVVLGEYSRSSNKTRALQIFERAYFLCRLAGEESQLFSLDRSAKEAKILGCIIELKSN